MRLLLAALTYLVSLAIVACIAFFAVLVIAGPHASLLPPPLEAMAVVLGWAAVMILPFFPARAVWRRITQATSVVPDPADDDSSRPVL